MGLKNLKLATATVETSGGDLIVRGLSLEDVVFLVRRHGMGLSAFFDMLVDMRNGKNLDLTDMRSLAGALAEAAPGAVAEAIALADADTVGFDDEAAAIARTLPFPDQIEALEKIGGVTFATEGALKKALETASRVARGATSALTSLRT